MESYLQFFWPKVKSQRKIDKRISYISKYKLKLMAKKENFPMAIFYLTERGPEVLYKDYDDLYDSKEEQIVVDNQIANLAVNVIAASAAGHTYNEGAFDFPLNDFKDYRLIFIAVSIPNSNYEDSRLKKGYYLVALFIPKWITMNLPSISKMENDLYDAVKNTINVSDDFYNKSLIKLKNKLVKILISYLEI